MKMQIITRAALFLILSVTIGKLSAQFSGAYAPANWGTVQVNSDGITNAGNAPTSIFMTSGNNSSGLPGNNDYTITVPQTGFITFTWNYTTVDGPQYDWPLYAVNGTTYFPTGYSTTGGSSQSGSQGCIPVNMGDVFLFRMWTVDNVVGAATCTFANFSFSTGNVTVTPTTASICPGGTVAFSASGGTNYVWSGGISNGVPFTPTASGIYTLTSGTGGCLVTRTAAVVYYPPITISGPTSNICANSTTILTASGGSGFLWNTGATTSTISITPSVTTSYAVNGITTNGCNSNASKTVTVDPGPPVTTAVSSTGGNGVCPGATVALSGAGATSYSWSGGISNGVPFAPPLSNTYVVTGYNSCGNSTAAITVSIHPLPTVTGVASQPTICSGNPVTLTGIGNATNYVWNGNVANGTNWFPSVNTTYTVLGTSAQSCTNSAQLTVTVVTTPVAPPLANPALICVGSTATLSSTGATNYTWTTPSGTLGTSQITVSPVSSTTYILTKANSNCVNTQTVALIVNPLPNVFAIVTPTLICASNQATLQGAGASTYTWSAAGPPVFTITGTSPVVSPSVSTLYTVTASDGTCVNTTTVFLATNPNPTILINPSSSVICQGQSVTLNASGAISYSWTSLGITSNTNAASITESPMVTTLYSLIGQNSFSCTSGTSQVVIVNNTPTLTVSSNKPLVCSNAPASLTVSANQQPATTYQWDANANNATTSVTIVNPPSTMVYSVTGTYTSTGCSSTKTIQVAVFLPTFAVNSPTSSCLGGSINLIASGATSYTWNGNQPFSQITVSPPTATVYQVAATSVSAGVSCVSTNTVVVSIYSNPTITAVPQRTLICKGESTNLLGSGGVTYLWSTSQTGSAVPVNPSSNTNYTVEGTDQNGCKGTAAVQLKVSTCIGISEYGALALLEIYPNPNNGTFIVRSEKPAIMHLYSELGQLIQTYELKGNDEQLSISDLAPGIYFVNADSGHMRNTYKIIVTR